jgi:phytoene dehydrogenase-like protein
MGGLADSLVSVCDQLGVTIFREAEVARIEVASNRVQAVRLADGRTLSARVIASSVDTNLTFGKFIDPVHLTDDFRQAIERIDFSSASAKINLAVSEPPNFKCLPGNAIGPQHHGTIHIGESIDWIEAAYDDAKRGLPSSRPILEITIPTSVDKTIAPQGKHIISMFIQYAPYRLKSGLHWDAIKDEFANRCVQLLGEYAPNILNAIEHIQVLSPLDLERTYGLTGGNIFQGAMSLHQLHMLRPVPGWSDHRTPIRGLYLCGAASHPGGGVMGACGRNAALEILHEGLV